MSLKTATLLALVASSAMLAMEIYWLMKYFGSGQEITAVITTTRLISIFFELSMALFFCVLFLKQKNE